MRNFYEDMKTIGVLILLLFFCGLLFYWVLAYDFLLLFSNNPSFVAVSIFAIIFIVIVFLIINFIVKDFDGASFLFIVISAILFFALYNKLNVDAFFQHFS